ncbi:AcrR family transcriptional regulator [Naumannella cuiyingiana]|uniref:AcrR family transcriptional regulator n=1 Tax=Naumannella cuiyingiana TaxID=1347891 RepID=A0A7Z0D905_9ACTN|nr:AcrR family transcriptional regulator [Naumannella cuiyingiana]
MSTSARGAYHHGDLRAALVQAARELLEAGEPFSLRAVARRAGVSPTAPYRHFADRDALESAVAGEGFTDLYGELAGLSTGAGADDVARFAVAYVNFALARPAVFRLMFGNECDDENDERVRASGALNELLIEGVRQRFPKADAPALATALWSLAHGLAFLHLDGKFAPRPASAVEERVRAAVAAVLSPAASR